LEFALTQFQHHSPSSRQANSPQVQTSIQRSSTSPLPHPANSCTICDPAKLLITSPNSQQDSDSWCQVNIFYEEIMHRTRMSCLFSRICLWAPFAAPAPQLSLYPMPEPHTPESTQYSSPNCSSCHVSSVPTQARCQRAVNEHALRLHQTTIMPNIPLQLALALCIARQ